MAYTGTVHTSFDYLLRPETKELTFHETEDDNAELVSYTDYIRTHDEDGYSPPKYLILDGVIHEFAIAWLLKLGKLNDWAPVHYDYDYGWSMETVYIFNEILTGPIDKEMLKAHKETKLVITVQKIKNKKRKADKSVESSGQEVNQNDSSSSDESEKSDEDSSSD